MLLTRRRFLTRAAAAGGVSLVYEAMTGLGLLATPAQASFELSGRVSGVRVLILGAGLAGMTPAYELGKVGFDCRVLEARPRPGGRVFTVRRGTVSEEEGPSQTGRIRRRPLVQRRADANFAPSRDDVGLLPRAAGAGGSVRGGLRERLSVSDQVEDADRTPGAATRGPGGFLRPRRGVAEQGAVPSATRSTAHDRRSGAATGVSPPARRPRPTASVPRLAAPQRVRGSVRAPALA